MEKHQSRVHGVARTKALKPTPADIELVRVQSFFTGNQYRPFLVRSDPAGPALLQGASMGLHAIVTHAVIPLLDAALDSIQLRYDAS